MISYTTLNSTPLSGGPSQNIVIQFSVEKLQWSGYPTMKKN